MSTPKGTPRIEFRLDDGTEHAIAIPGPPIVWRFGVRTPTGQVSSTFKIFSRRSRKNDRDDVYICKRGLDAVKVSLHQTGTRQVGFTSEYLKKLAERGHLIDPSRRFSDRWEEALSLGTGLTAEFALHFPTKHLTMAQSPDEDPDVFWVPSAPEGRDLELLLCAADQGDYLFRFEAGVRPVHFGQLEDKRTLMLVATAIEPRTYTNQADFLRPVKDDPRILEKFDPAGLRLLIDYKTDKNVRGWSDYSVAVLLAEHGMALPPKA